MVIACICGSVCPCVCVCVYQSRACLHDNSLPNLDQTCKTPWLRSLSFWWWSTLTFKVKFNLKNRILPHFELVRTITHQSFKLGSPNIGLKMYLITVKIPTNFGLDWFDLHFHFQSWNLFLYQMYLCSFCIIFSETCRLWILVRPSLMTDQISFGFALNMSLS